MRVPVRVLGDRPTSCSSSPTRSPPSSPANRCGRSGSARISPTVIRGFSEAYGSWKTIWNRRRIARAPAPRAWRSLPSNTTGPDVGRIRLSSSGPASTCRTPTRRRGRASRPARREGRRPRRPYDLATARPNTPPWTGNSLTRSRPRAAAAACRGLSARQRVQSVRRPHADSLTRPRRRALRRSGRPTGDRLAVGGTPARRPRTVRAARILAPGMERAPGRQVDQRRRCAGDGHQALVAHAVEPWQRRQQAQRVRMRGSRRTPRRPCPARPGGPRTSPSPGRRIPATTPRSWVMSRMAVSISLLISISTSSTCACTVTSSAVVGSSAMSSSGSHAIAIAIIARCRMPPENSCGYCRRALGLAECRPGRASRSARSRACLLRQPVVEPHISPICRPTVWTGFSAVSGSWKIIAISLPRICASVLVVRLSRSGPSRPRRRRSGGRGAAEHAHRRDRLAGTRLADDREHLARCISNETPSTALTYLVGVEPGRAGR